MGGVFQVDREIFDHNIWEDVVKFRIFFYILGQAIFAEEGVTIAGIKVERGQYLRSLRKLQEDLAYKEGRGGAIKTYPLTTLQNKIKTLTKDGQITIKSTESGTLFTVVNYALYQGFERFKKVEVEQLSNSNRTAIEQSPNNNKKVNKDKKDNLTSSPKFTTSDTENARLLFSKMKENNPGIKEPNFDKWSDDFRMMREIDERTDKQIKYLINWTQNDGFWKTNILSPIKLRKQFDQLALKAKVEYQQKNELPYKPKEQTSTNYKPFDPKDYLRSE